MVINYEYTIPGTVVTTSNWERSIPSSTMFFEQGYMVLETVAATFNQENKSQFQLQLLIMGM